MTATAIPARTRSEKPAVRGDRERRHHCFGRATSHPSTHLLGAWAGADLLVVGSRGLHGVSALGSVSERLAHEAHCSVLIVHEARSAQESCDITAWSDGDAGN